jgi:hypothetical protein
VRRCWAESCNRVSSALERAHREELRALDARAAIALLLGVVTAAALPRAGAARGAGAPDGGIAGGVAATPCDWA